MILRKQACANAPIAFEADVSVNVCCRTGFEVGGADRDRTDDLMLAKHALSQLSYGPDCHRSDQVVGPGRVERPTSRLSGVRSNHLSYEPGFSHSNARADRPRGSTERKGNEGGGTSYRLSKRCRRRSRERSAYADCLGGIYP
jgi:hypothetical protein